LTGFVVIAAAACGGPEEGDLEGFSDEPPAEEGSASLTDDLIYLPLDPEAPAEVSALHTDEAPAARVIYLHYADGNPLPRTDTNACKGTAPKFNCKFAPTLLECQKEIQGYLDKWYADFNVIFTLTRPKTGRFYTVVVSSGGGEWCDLDPKVAGVAPFLCKDIDGGVAYALLGGEDAKQTAVIIAQEQAHLVGLEHTNSNRDLLYPTICKNCDGFENVENTVRDDRCSRPKQNSYKMMKDRMGAWTGGKKPSAFGCEADTEVPTVQIMEPRNDAEVAKNFRVRVEAHDDCAISKVEVSLSPQQLTAASMAPPFQWDLTNIKGRQTITVVVTDGAGRTATGTVTVNAPGALNPDGTLMARERDGCVCQLPSGQGPGPGSLVLLLVGFGLALARSRRA
jgi:hypothetical protein